MFCNNLYTNPNLLIGIYSKLNGCLLIHTVNDVFLKCLNDVQYDKW